ncbi:hypothetical protein AUR66_11500 [Haloferax profundi]|uniref:Uncharacterized protein n=1 Tax=Haloferax profundi TaxID=1544718 RepID=A0A0W1SQV6_9EURY|nr:hypothetical protein AUR66_11500 [Haloferax profundi]
MFTKFSIMTTIRNKEKIQMHLTEETAKRVDDLYEKVNAYRTIDGKKKIEKNRHYYEALVCVALADEGLIIELLDDIE